MAKDILRSHYAQVSQDLFNMDKTDYLNPYHINPDFALNMNA